MAASAQPLDTFMVRMIAEGDSTLVHSWIRLWDSFDRCVSIYTVEFSGEYFVVRTLSGVQRRWPCFGPVDESYAWRRW